jgi:uncharacterized protein (DUF488 family)
MSASWGRPSISSSPRELGPARASICDRVTRRARPLYTVGHSTRTVDELVAILDAYAITRLVDIRSIPRSRTNPQFNRDTLPDALHAARIGYVHLAPLGGRRGRITSVDAQLNAGWRLAPFHNYADYAETATFEDGLDRLLAMAAQETCAIMCAEVLWWRCHRRIVADHVLARGIPVRHIMTRDKAEPAAMTPFAVVSPAGRISYPG